MAKYKVGDKVRIVSEMPSVRSFNPLMKKWLGKTVTIRHCLFNAYCIEEDVADRPPVGWCWAEEWISGLAEPEQKPYTVELRFDGMITTATLKRGGRDVKTAEARCNPKDTYSRAEGAKVAVERLFAKGNGSRKANYALCDKFVVTHSSSFHCFKCGEVVELIQKDGTCSRYENKSGTKQWVLDADLRPYKEENK